MRILIATAALFAATGVALAQPPIPTEPAARSAVADDDLGEAPVARRYDPLRVVCRRIRPPTGTRVIRDRGDTRLCQTVEEWERQSDKAQEIFRDNEGVCGSPDCGLGGP